MQYPSQSVQSTLVNAEIIRTDRLLLCETLIKEHGLTPSCTDACTTITPAQCSHCEILHRGLQLQLRLQLQLQLQLQQKPWWWIQAPRAKRISQVQQASACITMLQHQSDTVKALTMDEPQSPRPTAAMRGYTHLLAVTVTATAWIMSTIHFLAQFIFFEASCAHTPLFQVLKYMKWQALSKASARLSSLKCFVCMVSICRLTAASRISYITLAYRYMYSYTSVVQHIHTTMTVARTLVSIARPTMHQMMKASSTMPTFPHPKHANGRYWRRVRNRRRKIWKQAIALYIQIITTDPNPIQDNSQSYQQHYSTSSKDTTHKYTTPLSTQHTCQQWGGGSKRRHTDSYDCSSTYTLFSNRDGVAQQQPN